MGSYELNALTIEGELGWLEKIIEFRFKHYFGQEVVSGTVEQISPPDISKDPSIYASFINSHDLDFISRLTLIFSLTPHVRPQLFDNFFIRNKELNRGYTEFGGLKGSSHGGFLPTGETLAFIFCGQNLSKRMEVIRIFNTSHVFFQKKVLALDSANDNEPGLSGALIIYKEFIDLFTIGEYTKPNFSSKFPASLIESKLNWEDLVLDSSSKKSVNHMLEWIQKNKIIMDDWGMRKKIKPGYRALFYGPPGTGKTLTASLMGRATGRDVYKIDISMVSSKWVGETEKNLARIFDMAENKDWILFFDEADSIFGKRTNTGSAQEKHANQEVSYLLQRAEEYPGIVILASNLKGNIDEAFIRRFQSMIHFKMPSVNERFRLWNKAFDGHLKLDSSIDLFKISKDYELAGGAIVNVLKFCAIKAVSENNPVVTNHQLIEGIKSELMKEGKL